MIEHTTGNKARGILFISIAHSMQMGQIATKKRQPISKIGSRAMYSRKTPLPRTRCTACRFAIQQGKIATLLESLALLKS